MNTLKKVLAQIVLALLFGATAYVLLAGIDGVWAQDVTAEPVTEVTAEAPADITVEDGGTVVINQPAEPAPAPAVNPDLQALLIAAVSLAFLFVFSVFGNRLIAAAKDNVPPWALEPIFSAVDSILATVEANAKATTSPADDAEVAELRKKYEALKLELRTPKTPPAVG